MSWITDWTKIDEDLKYLACPINSRPEGGLYLGQPSWYRGWQVKQLRAGCFAAMIAPDFPVDGIIREPWGKPELVELERELGALLDKEPPATSAQIIEFCCYETTVPVGGITRQHLDDARKLIPALPLEPPVVSSVDIIAALRHGLEESVKLQSHYAKLLNQQDIAIHGSAGQRLQFKSADEWLSRLDEVDKKKGAT